jgi:hypothetical protein
MAHVQYTFISYFQAICKMPERTTIIGNEFKASFDHCDNRFCSEKHIEYTASMPQLKNLLEKSPSCKQSIKFDCYQAKLMVRFSFSGNFIHQFLMNIRTASQDLNLHSKLYIPSTLKCAVKC